MYLSSKFLFPLHANAPFLNSHIFLLPVLNQINWPNIWNKHHFYAVKSWTFTVFCFPHALSCEYMSGLWRLYIKWFSTHNVLRNKTTHAKKRTIYEKSCLLVLILKKIVDVYDKFHVLVMAIQYTPDYLRIFFICLNVVHGSFTNIYTIDCFINCLKNELERSAHFVECAD